MQQYRDERIEFTKEMKKDYTILFPNMLPIHFSLMRDVFRIHGYNCIMLKSEGQQVVDTGLESVHNDTCYPALLVIGQLLDAVETGDYDLDKLALLIVQTGGGCRASNYIHLLRKALKDRSKGQIPIISLNFSGLEKNSGFKLTVQLVMQLLYAILLGDYLMLLSNQSKPYEVEKGATDKIVDKWIVKIGEYFKKAKTKMKYKEIKKFYKEIIDDFASMERTNEKKVKVGIVGEIYVKYAPLGNNNLEDFLLSEGVEVVVPGLIDFVLYSTENGQIDRDLYGGGYWYAVVCKILYKFLYKKQDDIIKTIENHGMFTAPVPFEVTSKLADDYINKGIKMGEGWLLAAEMAELIHQGVNNIVCTQPFGCLPNHIIAKGKLRVMKDKHPESNIVAIDYDPGATQVNQENRIKLMLANAK